jgi:hypothetical protein
MEINKMQQLDHNKQHKICQHTEHPMGLRWFQADIDIIDNDG